jgi:hypothetical protein
VARIAIDTVSTPPPTSPPCTVRVYNNGTRRGLADRAANELRQQGWNVGVVANYNAVGIPKSSVYFRPGTQEEGPAKRLAAQLGVPALPRFDEIRNATPGVIVIVRENWGASLN